MIFASQTFQIYLQFPYKLSKAIAVYSQLFSPDEAKMIWNDAEINVGLLLSRAKGRWWVGIFGPFLVLWILEHS